MQLNCESIPGSLAPQSVLLTPAFHSLKFTVDTAGLVSSLKLSFSNIFFNFIFKLYIIVLVLPNIKMRMRLDTEIFLCVTEEVTSSKGELVHVDPAPPALG